MDAMTYETFVRRALGMHNKLCGRMLSRSEDPAGLADTSVHGLAANHPEYLIKAKAATIYGMAVVQESIERTLGPGNPLYGQCDPYMAAVFNAPDIAALTAEIKRFVQDVEFQAFPPSP